MKGKKLGEKILVWSRDKGLTKKWKGFAKK
jgi:hypothetical protein